MSWLFKNHIMHVQRPRVPLNGVSWFIHMCCFYIFQLSVRNFDQNPQNMEKTNGEPYWG